MHMADDSYDDSVTRLFGELKAGDQEAANRLWDVYFAALVREARQRLGSLPRRMEDEEDVAVSVFRRLCQGAGAGQFAEHRDRSDLWRLLVCITRTKVTDQVRRATRQKRGGGQVRGDSVWVGADGDISSYGLAQVAGKEPTPSMLVSLGEQHSRLLGLLRDDSLREIALLRMEGHSNEQIAEKVGMSLRSVERKLDLIRKRWRTELDSQG